ncbi:MAG: methyltransferase domain-containing protein [Methanobacteriaceae archaeon]|nr:methyltransferase domain-containing protein [Methanobacteriaceae archaeon]MDP2836770.1 methyltransferase domain-containing protein [Methanobacteriaceae archaeon]MDP3033994.1 methyltransferase domain-containing protein [Methanobacteriaceae archaeon]MDP3486034.1 methyltransferase domain-containing protein [Methanobacteriaceae archaeon]MDP3624605.1 methyltransferase domain-containing protein [Methanobacteriaceae archaeon]
MDAPFKIEGPIFIGRSWAEYLKMFDLDLEKLNKKKILDCAAGASSFTDFLSKKGIGVSAVDLLYDKDPEFLKRRCQEHLQALVESLGKMEDEFVWSFFKNLDDLKTHRMQSCQDFNRDYELNREKKYIKADLTQLPFEDNSFDMVLCAHLLFIYDHRLDWNFHLSSAEEMIRVSSNEVRIYPLVKNKGKKSIFVDKLIKNLPEELETEIVEVDYQFRRGGNEMLRIVKY